MREELPMKDFLNEAMLDISRRVGKIEMRRINKITVNGETVNTLITTAEGDYTLVITFCANLCLLREVTRNMKRSEVTSTEEVEIYAKEYFNILCGHVISSLNRKTQQKSRFGVPQMIKGNRLEELRKSYASCSKEELFYDSGGFGPVSLQSLLYQKNVEVLD